MSGHFKLLVGSAALLLVGCGLGAAVLGLSSAATAAGAARVAGPVAAPAAVPTPPATIRAALIRRPPRTARVGTLVPDSDLGQRVFVNRNLGFALAAFPGAQYPAKTTDGGAVWKTFGPALHLNALQAPLAVTQIGVASARTIYFFGSGQVVDVTHDGGRHWWRAFTQELSAAVVPGFGRRLLWFTQTQTGNSNAAVTWTYVSTDGGKVWHYTTALGGGF